MSHSFIEDNAALRAFCVAWHVAACSYLNVTKQFVFPSSFTRRGAGIMTARRAKTARELSSLLNTFAAIKARLLSITIVLRFS